MNKFNSYNEVVMPIELDVAKLRTAWFFDGVSKRNTTQVVTDPITVDGMKTKRLVVRSNLDQGFNITSQQFIGGLWANAGVAKTVPANPGTVIYPETDANLLALQLIGGQIRFIFDFAVAPTTGIITVRLDMLPV